MRIVITGADGLLGTALQKALSHHDLTTVDRPQIDIVDRPSVFALMIESEPDLVIHCAAYTDVDGCALNPELAYQINTLGTQNVALACQKYDIPLAHLSTNEVFSGENPSGYEEWMPLSPRNPYGLSKAAAEVAIQTLLSRYYIIRTAWLFSPNGHNFIQSILQKARDSGTVSVVADEIGNPTYVSDLAEAISRLVETDHYGIYHFVNSGACSRWGFANEILRLAGLDEVMNRPILSSAYQRPSTPPPFSALHNWNGAALGITLRPWQEALAEFLCDKRLG